MKLNFEWDEEKPQENFNKHKARFEEGKTISNDPFLWIFPDPEHSDSEQRYFDIGYSSKGGSVPVNGESPTAASKNAHFSE